MARMGGGIQVNLISNCGRFTAVRSDYRDAGLKPGCVYLAVRMVGGRDTWLISYTLADVERYWRPR